MVGDDLRIGVEGRALMMTSTPATTAMTSHCSRGALTGTLGLFVQALLALVAFSALIVKRYCEPIKTRRVWKTWWLDTSKQAVGAGVIHVINVVLSEHLFSGDPCSWYVITFMLDSTVGLIIICICLKLSLWLIVRRRWHHLVFGTYALPSPCRSWLYQCSVYIVVILIEKVIVTLLTLSDLWKKVGDWILSRTTDADLELVVVMFIIPLIVNAIIFWIVDNFLKLHHPSPSAGKKQHNKFGEHRGHGLMDVGGHAIPTPDIIPNQILHQTSTNGSIFNSDFARYQPLSTGDELVPLVRIDLNDDEDLPEPEVVTSDRTGHAVLRPTCHINAF